MRSNILIVAAVLGLLAAGLAATAGADTARSTDTELNLVA